MNKKKMFCLIADLCSDAIHFSRQSTEQNAIEAAFRCFDTAVDALEYAAARKTTAELEKSAEVYEQAQQQYEKAEAQKNRMLPRAPVMNSRKHGKQGWRN